MSRINKILNILNEGPKVLNEISGLLEEPVSKATLKRDLSKLLEQKLIVKLGQGKNTKYELSSIYSLVKEIDVEEYFQEDLYTRKIKDKFDSEIIQILNQCKNDLLTDFEKKHLSKLNIEFRKRKSNLDKTILKQEYERLCIELAWKSSSIEGNTYSILETEALIKAGIEAKGHKKEEAIMILNHKKTLDYILSKPAYFLNLDLPKVQEIHNILTQDLDINQGVRSQLVGISGTRYRPPGNKFNIENYLNELCELVNSIDGVIEKSLVSLAMIAYLQAFMDGNKRTSRMVANSILIAHDFCPLSFGSIDEYEYKKALVLFYEQNNISYLKKLLIEQFEFAMNNYFQ